jgi:hypothetical protein
VPYKNVVYKSFEENLKPLWRKVWQMGLSKEELDTIIEEARTKCNS